MPAGAARVLGWLLIFGVGMVATRVLAWALSRLFRMSILGWLDNWGGALLGLAGGLLLGSILLMLATHSPGMDGLRDVIRQNAVPRFVYATAPAIYDIVVDDEADVRELWEKVRHEMERFEDIGRQVDDVREALTDKLDDD